MYFYMKSYKFLLEIGSRGPAMLKTLLKIGSRGPAIGAPVDIVLFGELLDDLAWPWFQWPWDPRKFIKQIIKYKHHSNNQANDKKNHKKPKKSQLLK